LRGALYLAVVLAVYLDHQDRTHAWILPTAKWLFLPLLVMAVAVGMRLSRDRRFTLTTLDVLLIFIIVALPNLPGLGVMTGPPENLSTSLGKVVALVYGIELCVDRSSPALRTVSAGIACFAAVLTVRAFF
jgi:UDP-GlcNAc:undecaprenyl-phosphate/decaprenyl-phosphate GlcNAc-1-phosphate transferase